jgi:hypothetical protein
MCNQIEVQRVKNRLTHISLVSLIYKRNNQIKNIKTLLDFCECINLSKIIEELKETDKAD